MSTESVTRTGVSPVTPESLPRRPLAVPRLLKDSRLTRLVAFGAIGGVAFVVDVGIYNLLRVTLLQDQPIGAKVVSVATATIVAWVGNRSLTFRDRLPGPVLREATLFALTNVLGLVVAAICLFISHYALQLDSTLADNISANVVGLALGMIVRFLGYRYLVFRRP